MTDRDYDIHPRWYNDAFAILPAMCLFMVVVMVVGAVKSCTQDKEDNNHEHKEQYN